MKVVIHSGGGPIDWIIQVVESTTWVLVHMIALIFTKRIQTLAVPQHLLLNASNHALKGCTNILGVLVSMASTYGSVFAFAVTLYIHKSTVTDVIPLLGGFTII
jgi:hypothetical protein